jgi:Site-specific DNA methylase
MKSIDGWLDLCSGIGAGFPYAGIKLWGRSPNLFCEKDEYYRRIINQRYPGRPIATDVNRTEWKFNYNTNLITATPPCQPFSVDGNQLGSNDVKNCFPAVLSAIRELQPQFTVIKNVAGLLSCRTRPGNDQPYFAGILNELSESGYDVEWQAISLAHFGAP